MLLRGTGINGYPGIALAFTCCETDRRYGIVFIELSDSEQMDFQGIGETGDMDIYKKAVLYVVIPCYNEEVLPITAPLFREKMYLLSERELISEDSKILFVNAGSKVRTWEVLTNLCNSDPTFCSIKLSRNCGHQM